MGNERRGDRERSSSYLSDRGSDGAQRFLLAALFYEMVIGSSLAFLLLEALKAMGFRVESGFLYWNLFLAWVPYLGSLAMMALYCSPNGRRWAIFPALVWLAFFPNAPYLVTDIIHLPEVAPFGWGSNLGLLVLFAWLGLFLAVISLHMVHLVVEDLFGRVVGWLSVAALIGLCSMGIYLGRVERWNSWDVLRHPHLILDDLIVPMIHPRSHMGVWGFIGIYAMLVGISYLTFVGARRHPMLQMKESA